MGTPRHYQHQVVGGRDGSVGEREGPLIVTFLQCCPIQDGAGSYKVPIIVRRGLIGTDRAPSSVNVQIN